MKNQVSFNKDMIKSQTNLMAPHLISWNNKSVAVELDQPEEEENLSLKKFSWVIKIICYLVVK